MIPSAGREGSSYGEVKSSSAVWDGVAWRGVAQQGGKGTRKPGGESLTRRDEHFAPSPLCGHACLYQVGRGGVDACPAADFKGPILAGRFGAPGHECDVAGS